MSEQFFESVEERKRVEKELDEQISYSSQLSCILIEAEHLLKEVKANEGLCQYASENIKKLETHVKNIRFLMSPPRYGPLLTSKTSFFVIKDYIDKIKEQKKEYEKRRCQH